MKTIALLLVLLVPSSSFASDCGVWNGVTHKQLYDAAITIQKDLSICKANGRRLQRMLDVRTSSAAKTRMLPVVQRRTDFRDIALSVFVGVFAGYALSRVIDKR